MSARFARNRWLATLLALAMLCAQAIALRHAAQHHLDGGSVGTAARSTDAGGTPASKHGLGGSDSCLQCLTIQQLSSALPSTHFQVEAAPHTLAAADAHTAPVGSHTRVGPPARGPPLLS